MEDFGGGWYRGEPKEIPYVSAWIRVDTDIPDTKENRRKIELVWKMEEVTEEYYDMKADVYGDDKEWQGKIEFEDEKPDTMISFSEACVAYYPYEEPVHYRRRRGYDD